MRSGIITIAIVALLSICTFSCGGSSGGDSEIQRPVGEVGGSPEGGALSENELASNPILQVNADRDTYVTFLEPIDSSEELNLTGELGFDLFSYVYEMPINHTICWEDDDPGAAHSITISNSTGTQVLRADANGGCVTEFIAPGIYEARVDHDNFSESILPIFFVPQFTQLASTEKGFLDDTLNSFNAFISKLNPVYLSHAQTESLDITTIIKTKSCMSCNLQDIVLRAQDLSGVNFEGSVFNGAILEAAVLSNTNLSNSVLSSTDLRATSFEGTNLMGANLSFAEIDNCTNFFDADLTGALWVDGCTCSSSTCSNCAEIPMMQAPEGLLGAGACVRFPGPIVDPGGPIVFPDDNPDDAPIAFDN